jgi:CBS domain-containing protein
MQAQDIMTAELISVTPDTLIDDAARLMKEQNVGMLPVVQVDGSKKLVGVITDRDITLRHVAEGHPGKTCRVREAMTEHVTTCAPNTDVKEVMAVMGREQVRRVPIVDGRASLVGVVAQADIARRADDAKATGRTLEQISEPK